MREAKVISTNDFIINEMNLLQGVILNYVILLGASDKQIDTAKKLIFDAVQSTSRKIQEIVERNVDLEIDTFKIR